MSGSTTRLASPPTAAVHALLPAIELLERRDAGLARQVWRDLGLDPSLRDTPDERVAARVVVDLFERTSVLLDDPHIGLRVAASTGLQRMRVLFSFVLHHSTDVREALRRACRFNRLLNEGLRVELEEGRSAVLRFRLDRTVAHRAGVRHLLEVAIASALGMLRGLVDPALAPARVDFSVPAPADDSELRRSFRAEVYWNQPVTALTLPAAVLGLRPRDADADLGQVLERYASELLSKLPTGSRSWADRVRVTLLDSSAASPDMQLVARRLGVSSRSLQRRLSEEGESFAQLEDEARRQRAVHYVTASDLDMQSIAWLLGFNDNSAFYRAFRRWTGSTPLRFRAQGGPSVRAD